MEGKSEPINALSKGLPSVVRCPVREAEQEAAMQRVGNAKEVSGSMQKEVAKMALGY